MSTTGHESEAINVGGLKASLQKFKTDIVDEGLSEKQDTISDLSDIRSGASKGETSYQKPSGGIPKSDLATAVQTSLEKADTALQSHQDISGKQDKVAKLGSTSKPVYTSVAGTFAECSTYAGGTAVTLNGTSKSADSASFYAPTAAGTSGQYLVSSGSGAPSWQSVASVQTCKDIISELS